jgi:eukaryotic-like serine/threonine-protein kinase
VIGQSIVHYKITGKLGAGGMGEVYRATDSQLGREVAIKVLPESFTGDQERLARFQREAKVLASLTHTNIAGIYGLEQTVSVCALILELVEGKTLAEKIAEGPMPIDEALEVCRQIAEALSAAHAQGVVHRDIKPANIKISDDGTVKVLDFGLAKEVEGSDSSVSATVQNDSPTLTDQFTKPGTILGTAAYMSPEQARGKPTDKRSDVWSFGCVLYECLSGRKAFAGEDTTETLAGIIKGDPDWSALPPNLPILVRLLLEKTLVKDRKQRLQDIGDARLDLERACAEPDFGPCAERGFRPSS